MDPARWRSIIDTMAPSVAGSGAGVKLALTPADLATDQFPDPAIRLE